MSAPSRFGGVFYEIGPMRARAKAAIFNVGDRVRLRPDAPLLRHHPALAGAVGIVGSVIRGPQWSRLTSSPLERAADLAVHVRFIPPQNVILLNVEANQIERDEQT